MKRLALSAILLAWCHTAAAAIPGDCGTVVLPVGGGTGPATDITSLNPLFSDSTYNLESAALMYPTLLWINRFARIDWSRSLASAVTTKDDRNFLVTLRHWSWSDGVPLEAKDVVYYFTLGKALGPSWPQFGAGGLPYIVQSIKIIDPMRLMITTTHAVNPTWFIYNAIAALEPLPEHAWHNVTLSEMRARQTSPAFFRVVDGPLAIQRLDIGLDAIFIPNPAWPGPKMHFSRLVFSFLQGDGAAVQGVESGSMDAGEVPTDLFQAVQHIPGVRVEIMRQELFQNVIYVNFRNPRVAFFRDVRVRQAMIDSFDQNGIVRELEHGAGDPAYGPVPRSLTSFLAPPMRQGIYPVGYDPARSVRLLEQAGFRPGPDGVMEKNGQKLSFTYMAESGSDAVTELEETLQADLRRVGIEMKIHLVDFNQLLALLNGPPEGWDATGVAISTPSYPTGEAEFATGAYQHSGGYSNPEMDRLISASITQPGIEPLYQYETFASAQQPVIFTPRERPVILVSDRLHGMRDFVDPATVFAPDKLYCTAPPEASR